MTVTATPLAARSQPSFVGRVRQFLRTPKGTLLALFLGLFALGASAVGWPLAATHMLAAVLGASLTELAVSWMGRRRCATPGALVRACASAL